MLRGLLLKEDKMCLVPSSESSSSRNTVDTNRSTTISNVTWMKPFLLGFVFAILTVLVASLFSIRLLCRNYTQSHVHSPPDVNGLLSNNCHSSQSVEKRPKGGKGPLLWWEAVPFLSFVVPKRKKFGLEGQTNDNAICTEEHPLLAKPDPWRCLCQVIWDPLVRNEKLGKTSREETVETADPLTSEQQHPQTKGTEKFPSAFTPEIAILTLQQENLVRKMGSHVFDRISDFERRSLSVPWGGPSQAPEALSFDWYARKKTNRGIKAPLDQIDGGNLFSSYLRIMRWPTTFDHVDFPFKLCKEKKKIDGKGCDTSNAIQHTLEFRERFKPWLITPSIKRQNSHGLVYARGFSPSYSENEVGGHTIVWLRLAKKVKPIDENDRIFFVRSMIREFDVAVAASLLRSNGRVGKFNAVVDGENFTWSKMPSLSAVKGLVAILQDHFADRLGVVLLVNVGSIGEMLLKLFIPLITEEVRNKLIILPNDPDARLETLQAVLGPKSNIPKQLGGTDDYAFNVDEYYNNEFVSRDEEALEYLSTMPYHA